MLKEILLEWSLFIAICALSYAFFGSGSFTSYVFYTLVGVIVTRMIYIAGIDR